MTAPESIEAVAEAVLGDREQLAGVIEGVVWRMTTVRADHHENCAGDCRSCPVQVEDDLAPSELASHILASDWLAAHVAQALATALAAREQDALATALHEAWLRVHVTRFDDEEPDDFYNGVAKSARIISNYRDELRSERADAVGGET